MRACGKQSRLDRESFILRSSLDNAIGSPFFTADRGDAPKGLVFSIAGDSDMKVRLIFATIAFVLVAGIQFPYDANAQMAKKQSGKRSDPVRRNAETNEIDSPPNGQTHFRIGPKEITNSIGMKLVLIPRGTFTMGAPVGQEGAESDEGQHQVTISKEFYIGAFEVTQGQYEQVMGRNYSHFHQRLVGESDSAMHPVEQVSWEDAVEFCDRLTELPGEKRAGRFYRLPTEAEWEYACRAGSKSAFHFGDASKTLGDYAWFIENSNSQTHPVGLKKPNAWGLYDMHGNVWEWCSDWYGEYSEVAVTNPVGPRVGSDRVLRGGAWSMVAQGCRSSHRNGTLPSGCNGRIGFRVATSPYRMPK
jgi:formylglycine-generating enzyme required for sulfatase activity